MKPADQLAEDYLQRRIDRLPVRLRKAVDWLRRPRARYLRIPAGGLLILAGVFWFLPVVGFWMLPLGILMLVEDIPPVKRWLVRVLMRLERR